MNKKQFLTLEVTMLVIIVLLCIGICSNGRSMKEKDTVEQTEVIETSTIEAYDENKNDNVTIAKNVTTVEDTKTFSSFPGVKSLTSVITQIKQLSGDTYKQRQNNFEKMDIFVQEEVVISPLSDCFPQKTVDISIYDDRSIVTILNEEREEKEVQLFMPYTIYQKDGEIILEGVDRNTRKYYEYHFQNKNLYIYGGENADVPDEEKDFIFLTFYNGTYTLNGNKLSFWYFLDKQATGEIPEPVEPQNVRFCNNSYGYTLIQEEYCGLPYLDKNGNIINLLVTTESESWKSFNPDIFITNIDYTIIASNVKKIIDSDSYNSFNYVVYQNESNEYNLAFISKEGKLQKVIELNDETVSKVHFGQYGGAVYGKSWISGLTICYEVKGYGSFTHHIYELENSIILNESTKRLKSLLSEEFSASEFDKKYQNVLNEIKKLNSGNL